MKLLSSWGVLVSQWPEGGRWLIFMSLSTPAYINQSQPPSRKGVGHGWCGKREMVTATERKRGSGKREMGCCHFKGLWTGHHAFRSAIAAQEFGKFSRRMQGLDLMHANVWRVCGVLLILCLPFFFLVLNGWANVSNIQYLYFFFLIRTEFMQCIRLSCAQQIPV